MGWKHLSNRLNLNLTIMMKLKNQVREEPLSQKRVVRRKGSASLIREKEKVTMVENPIKIDLKEI